MSDFGAAVIGIGSSGRKGGHPNRRRLHAQPPSYRSRADDEGFCRRQGPVPTIFAAAKGRVRRYTK